MTDKMTKKEIRRTLSGFELECLDNLRGIVRFPVGDGYDGALDAAREYQEDGRRVSIWGTDRNGNRIRCKSLRAKFY